MDGEQVVLGRISQSPFETTGRSSSWAEQRVASVNIVGKYDQLVDRVKPGDSMAKFAGWFDGKFDDKMFVRTVELSASDGVTGELKLSLLRCMQGKTKPYNVTWDVGMEEVQMKLINHPMILKNADVTHLLKWEDTPASLRVVSGPDGELSFRYDDGVWSSGGFSPKPITAPWEVAYCKAVTQGIETYNKYLPVITKNSFYLELSGARYNEDHVITGGTIVDFTGSAVIGHFDAPELKVAGYIDNKDGVWFKNGDKFTSQADGTWTRTESWVFTNDPSHMWIYTNQLEN